MVSIVSSPDGWHCKWQEGAARGHGRHIFRELGIEQGARPGRSGETLDGFSFAADSCLYAGSLYAAMSGGYSAYAGRLYAAAGITALVADMKAYIQARGMVSAGLTSLIA